VIGNFLPDSAGSDPRFQHIWYISLVKMLECNPLRRSTSFGISAVEATAQQGAAHECTSFLSSAFPKCINSRCLSPSFRPLSMSQKETGRTLASSGTALHLASARHRRWTPPSSPGALPSERRSPSQESASACSHCELALEMRVGLKERSGFAVRYLKNYLQGPNPCGTPTLRGTWPRWRPIANDWLRYKAPGTHSRC
jgi:hypothetical protein